MRWWNKFYMYFNWSRLQLWPRQLPIDSLESPLKSLWQQQSSLSQTWWWSAKVAWLWKGGWGTWLPLPRPDACFGPRSQISRNYAQIPALKCAADWNTTKLSIPSQNAQIPAPKKNVTKRLNVWRTCGPHKGSKGHSFITRGAGSRIVFVQSRDFWLYSLRYNFCVNLLHCIVLALPCLAFVASFLY